ncbi:MAG: NapC/NirT family cytochrome c, partial [Candidatus Aminicenantes bacterium]|nr:NapC/NirT family cytochrome c [Candidatus Aminicenantes bacterium]
MPSSKAATGSLLIAAVVLGLAGIGGFVFLFARNFNIYWRQRRLVEAPNRTFAEGLATGTAFALPQAILWEGLDD